MNKQEAIKELESHKMIGTDARSACYNEAIKAGILVIKKLDEPQKPVVPQFVADWFEDNKHDIELGLYSATLNAECGDHEDYAEFYDWLKDWNTTPYETITKMKYGYEVEQKPLYYVYFPEITASAGIEEAYLMKTRNGVELADNNDFDDMKFTESEIKAIDERYWAFAMPVEEVAEG